MPFVNATPRRRDAKLKSLAAPSNLEINLARHEGVDAAFDFFETDPAPRPFIFAARGFARAGQAADGPVALVVQRIERNLVLTDVPPNRLARPVGHRVQLHNVGAALSIQRVEFDQADVGAGARLMAPEACDPALQ